MKSFSVITVLLSLIWQIGVCPNGCVHHHGFFDHIEAGRHDDVHLEFDGDCEVESTPLLSDSHQCDGIGKPKFHTERSRHLTQWDFEREQAGPVDSVTVVRKYSLRMINRHVAGTSSCMSGSERARLQKWVV